MKLHDSSNTIVLFQCVDRKSELTFFLRIAQCDLASDHCGLGSKPMFQGFLDENVKISSQQYRTWSDCRNVKAALALCWWQNLNQVAACGQRVKSLIPGLCCVFVLTVFIQGKSIRPRLVLCSMYDGPVSPIHSGHLYLRLSTPVCPVQLPVLQI